MLVSGCEGEDRNIAIQSIEHCDTDATLLRNGTFHFPEILDNTLAQDSYEEPEETRERRSLSATDDYQYKEYDEEYLENDYFDKAFPVLKYLEFEEPIFPKVLRLPVHVYLSPSWIGLVGKTNPKTARTEAKKVLARANEHFNHRSMQPSKIELVYRDETFFDAAHELSPCRDDMKWLRCQTHEENKSCFVNLSEDEREGVAVVYLTASPASFAGLAYPQSICGKEMAASITAMDTKGDGSLPLHKTGITLAHEIAHNFGIYHDFENHDNKPEKIARTKTCGPPMWEGGDNNLIMNYGHPRQAKWSDCSNEDFSNYFIRVVQHTNDFCLKEDPGSATTPRSANTPGSSNTQRLSPILSLFVLLAFKI